MTTITPFAAGSYLTTRNAAQLTTLKNQLNDLSNQVSSGQVSQTYGGLGSGRSTALAAQATLSALGGYAAGITAGQTRTKLAVTSLTQVATLGTSARQSLNNGLQSAATSSIAGRSTALGNLETVLDTLNQSAAGNYLFGGADASTQPVLDADTILNGSTNSDGTLKAGLTKLIKDQVAADLGSGSGWLTTSLSGSAVTVAEKDPTRTSFGFNVGGASSTTTAITATANPGTTSTPGTINLAVNSPPAAGDSVTVTLKMHDGTSTTLTLTAVSGNTATSTSSTGATFAIGSDAQTTANNLNIALQGAITAAAAGTLAVSSTAIAAKNFFSGSASAGIIPQRIDFSGAAPVYVPGTKDNTVLWYQGEDTRSAPPALQPTSALSTQSVQISSTASVGTGARANDGAIQNVLAGLATMAYGLPTTSDGNTIATYQAVIDRAGNLLSSTDTTSPSVQDTVTQLSLASARLSSAGTTNTATQNTVQNTLDGIEQASPEEVIAKLLDVQNRLQASYQITSTLSKLSLVNYIS
ncbi:flagellin [Methylobacterium sp. P1-11]|uniref:flagellin n=1 Tax=Methylobacterium sp. P1-11 TaxID=2024616 RepID=UPI0011ED5A98|nr:flagellin [Methylobacterium sp. P1-11]KAA0118934.1 flagellin [Methylobacterium sp. P1-11]